MSTITLSEADYCKIIKDATAAVTQNILLERRTQLDTLLPVEVCGMLKINQKTLDTLKAGPPRVTLVPGSVVRYMASDVAEYLQGRRDAK